MTVLGPNGQGPEPLLPPWQSVGVGHVNNPDMPAQHIAVSLAVGTVNGQLFGALVPEVARQLGQELIDHADTCSVGLSVAGELPLDEMRQS